MSETYITDDKSTQELFLLGDKSPEITSWDSAIEYAKQRIESLQAAVKVFTKYRDSGEPFIGESENGKAA